MREASKTWAAYSKGTYRTEGSGASSYGHNAIIIDDRGQLPSGDGLGIEGRIRYARETEGFWRVGTDAKAAYNKDDYNPVQVADRHIAFPKATGDCLVMIDRVVPQAAGAHAFKRLLHFAAPEQLAQEDGPGRMSVTIRKTVYDLWTLSPTEGMTADQVEALSQVPIRTRTLLAHDLSDEALWLCTVLAARGTETTPTDVQLVAGNDGPAVQLDLSGGATWRFALSGETEELAVDLGSA